MIIYCLCHYVHCSIMFLSILSMDIWSQQLFPFLKLNNNKIMLSIKFYKLHSILIHDTTSISTHHSFISLCFSHVKISHNDGQIMFWNFFYFSFKCLIIILFNTTFWVVCLGIDIDMYLIWMFWLAWCWVLTLFSFHSLDDILLIL